MKYFDQYDRLIKEKKIIVNKWIKLSIKRVKRYKKQYIFIQEKADQMIDFIENECSNTKGSNGKLKLALPQKVWLEVAFGFYYAGKFTMTNPDTLEEYTKTEVRRLINEVPLVIARGSGKTTIAAAIGDAMQIADGEIGADVQLLAYDRKQAGYLFEANRAMIENTDSLLNMLYKQQLLHSTRAGIMYFPTRSLMQIATSDYDSLDGSNCHLSIFDEVHTYEQDFIKVATDGSRKKRKNWMAWYVTTNGVKRGAVFDKYFDFWTNILQDFQHNDHIMPWLYWLDNAKEIEDQTKWQKAVPLIGITTSPEVIKQEIEDAKNDPVAQAEIMTKTFGLAVNDFLSYFTTDECMGNKEAFNSELFKGTDDKNAYAILGIDLSDVNDICSIAFMIIKDKKYYFVTKKFMPRNRVESLNKDQRDKYLSWEQQGYLIIHDKEYNDREYIYEELKQFMTENKIYPVAVGYDEWHAPEIIRMFEQDYSSVFYRVAQNVKTLSDPLKIYKALMKSGDIVFDDPISTWNHGNVKVKIDANFNIFPNKEKAKDKIDVFASQLDAFVCWQNNKEDLQYYFEE